MEASGKEQVSEIDPDARLLRRNGRSVIGYNGQIAVDDKTRLIVATDRVQDSNDSQQLEPMMTQASEAMESGELKGLADAGYANNTHLKGCEDKGMEMYVPLYHQPGRKGYDGRFGTVDFHDDKATDCYVCPAGQKLVRTSKTATVRGNRYLICSPDAKVCGSCPLASSCLPRTKKFRRINRWEHADVIDRHRQRMVMYNGGIMSKRGSLVEHPFGTLKSWAGIHHFLMRGLAQCRDEFNLMTLCYNFKRVLKEIGVGAFVAYCRVRKEAQGIGMRFFPGRSVFFVIFGQNRHSGRWLWQTMKCCWKWHDMKWILVRNNDIL